MPIKKQLPIFSPGLVLAILGTLFGTYWLINVDVAAQLELSAQLLDGERPYQDIFDTQFPAAYFIPLISAGISRWLDINSVDVFFGVTFFLLNGCIFLTWYILRPNPLFKTHLSQSVLVFTLYFSLFILPFLENNWHLSFGEREHLFCGLVLPYLALAVNKIVIVQPPLSPSLPLKGGGGFQVGRWSHGWIALLAGLLAGIGFAIKPHFLVILIVSEIYLFWKCKKDAPTSPAGGRGENFGKHDACRSCFVSVLSSWLRLENITILVFLSLYFLSFALFFPTYFELVPYIVDFYKGVAAPKDVMVPRCLFLLLITLLLSFWYFLEKRKLGITWYLVPYLLSLCIASIGTFALGAGAFYYHSFPFRFFVFLTFAFMLCTCPRKSFKVVFPLLIVAVLLKFGIQQYAYAKEKRTLVFEMVNTLKTYAPRSTVVTLSSSLAPTFPVINYAGAKWGLSMPWLLYIARAYQDHHENPTHPPYHSPSDMGKTERFFHEKVMHDLQTDLPKLVLVDESPQKEWLGKMRFDFIQYFSKDPRFVTLWKNYKWVSRVSNPNQTIVFDFYQLQTPL